MLVITRGKPQISSSSCVRSPAVVTPRSPAQQLRAAQHREVGSGHLRGALLLVLAVPWTARTAKVAKQCTKMYPEAMEYQNVPEKIWGYGFWSGSCERNWDWRGYFWRGTLGFQQPKGAWNQLFDGALVGLVRCYRNFWLCEGENHGIWGFQQHTWGLIYLILYLSQCV